jgi:hypothetical protein
MKQKITCPCGSSFSVEVEEEINLDLNPETLDQIMDGSFLNFNCPDCGKKHKPEFKIFLDWPSKKIKLEALPELDRGGFYRRKKDTPGTETVIGYPELADRLSVIRDGLEPVAIESLKYYLLLKAEENYPDQEMSVWYHGKDLGQSECIEFHIQGIKEDEVAVSRIPLALYEKTLADYKKHPRQELFSSLRTRSYLSVLNMQWPEELK